MAVLHQRLHTVLAPVVGTRVFVPVPHVPRARAGRSSGGVATPPRPLEGGGMILRRILAAHLSMTFRIFTIAHADPGTGWPSNLVSNLGRIS